jgi:hypothetical protein
VADALERWAAERAREIVARAEADAVEDVRGTLRRALLDAVARELEGERREEPEPAPAPEPRRAEPPPETGEGLWAYCVGRRGELARVGGTPGVHRAGAVELVEHAGLGALVSRVPLAEFGEEPLKRNLNDLDWLQAVARAHEGVLDRGLAEGPIVPLRLCTIYEATQHVREMLEEERERLHGLLAALEGRSEWGVKLLVDDDALQRAASPERAAEREVESQSGGAYLARRREERAAREAADALARELAEEVHARLQDWAIDAVLNPPQNRELSGHEGVMLLNGAYLVEDDRAERFRDVVEELGTRHAALGARLELTGPWPAFTFIPRLEAAAR